MNQLHFDVNGDTLLATEVPEILNSEGVELVFSPDYDWTQAQKVYIVFSSPSLAAPLPILLEGTSCQVPTEVLSEGGFIFGLIAQTWGLRSFATDGMRVDLVQNTISNTVFPLASVDLLAMVWQGDSDLRLSEADRIQLESALRINPVAGIPSEEVQLANPNILYWEE